MVSLSLTLLVPDFRSLRKSSQSLFDISAYCSAEATERLHTLIQELSALSMQARPTSFHRFMDALALKGSLLRHYTQNIDCIEHHLVHLWAKTVQLHGRIDQARCQSCGSIVTLAAVDTFCGSELPGCGRCQEAVLNRERRGQRKLGVGRLRPNVVLYGEENPNGDAIGRLTEKDLRNGPNVVLVVGTGLKVRGAKVLVRELCHSAKARGGLAVWVNKDLPPSDLGFSFDFVFRGDCDEMASVLLK